MTTPNQRQRPMAAEAKPDLKLEIAHLLLIDIVGYSRLLVNEQIEVLAKLNQAVRSSECFRSAEAGGKLIRLPTGDGMALLFFNSPEQPVNCALEISAQLKNHPEMHVRMGVHSGPVNQVTDVNDRLNVAGAGINTAQRVMDCGDAGHILLSKHLADDLANYRHWQPYLHDLGECEVKHGQKLHVVNLYKEGSGNPAVPEKLKRGWQWKQKLGTFATPSAPHIAALAAVLLSIIALAFTLSIFFRRGSHGITRIGASISAPIPEKSIAVLPFENLSDEKSNAFFTSGVQDEILTNLAKVADLKVISRTSVMQYKADAARNLREIAKTLGVAHILEGTVQRMGGRVRVSAQLIDARTDAHLWAEHYDRELADVFDLESELAETIVSQLKLKLSAEEKAAIEEQPTSDLAAYDLYSRARFLMAKAVYVEWGPNLSEAARLLNAAVARDPAFFLAYCELASVHDQFYLAGADRTPARLELARAAIDAAVRLRPDSGETHLAVAGHLYCGFLDYDRARDELAKAQRVLPNEPRIFELAGYIDRRQGHWPESTRSFERALELDPRNFYILQQLARSYDFLRRFADEIAMLERAMAILPQDIGVRLARAIVELSWHADPKPLHDTIAAVIAENPKAKPVLADTWFSLAMCERDSAAARDAVANMSGTYSNEGFTFPRSLAEALIAQLRGEKDAARVAFAAARVEAEKAVHNTPGYAPALGVLALVDAGLGRKQEAIREGREAVELLPITKDAINGAILIENLAIIYAWTGEKDLALQQLAHAAEIPCDVSYGNLRLQPYWDPLRGEPQFEKIVRSLTPK